MSTATLSSPSKPQIRTPLPPVLLKPGEGRTEWVLGDRYTYKVTGRDTDGQLLMIELAIWPGNGTPPHIHLREDETFYVLEGDFDFRAGDDHFHGTTGAFVHIPRGNVHCFKNIGTKPGRLLVQLSPAGFEGLLEELGQPVTDPNVPAPYDPAILANFPDWARRFHMELVD